MKIFILVAAILFCSSSYSQKAINVKSDATASYIPPNYITDKGKEFQISTGAFLFDATKRMSIYNLIKNEDNSYLVKYLAEEQPDVVYDIIKDFLSKATINVQNKITVDAEVTNLVQKLTNQLTNKSEALNFLRTSLYRLNESAFNEDINEESYKELFKLVITTTNNIKASSLKKEEVPLKLNNKTN